MKLRLSILSIGVLLSMATTGQQVITEVGRVSTRYDYRDSEGERLENLFPQNHFSYSVGYRKSMGKRLYLTGTLLYNTYGNEGSDPLYGTYYLWRTEHLGLRASAEMELYKQKGFSALITAGLSPQIMLTGTQQIGDDIYDLKGVEQFDTPFLFYQGGVGMNYCSNTTMAVSMKYWFGKGIPFSASEDGEQLNLITSTVTIGVLWSFRSCDYCYRRRFKN